MLRRFSRDAMLIVRLRTVGVDRSTARALIERVAGELGAPPPDVTFHRGRGPHTGYCRHPRSRAVALGGEGFVAAWEMKKGPWPEHGMIRLGDPSSLGTIAHELGHDLVNHFDATGTAPHGKVWVGRFDDAAALIDRLVRLTG
jgi:CO/xanthine dehydrogenase Mo-binding subunit